jgi:hypothetical protein
MPIPEPEGHAEFRNQVDDCLCRLVAIPKLTPTPGNTLNTYELYAAAKQIETPEDHTIRSTVDGKPLAAAVGQWRLHRYMELFIPPILDALEEDDTNLRSLITNAYAIIDDAEVMGNFSLPEALHREELCSTDDHTHEGIYFILYGLAYPSTCGYTWA